MAILRNVAHAWSLTFRVCLLLPCMVLFAARLLVTLDHLAEAVVVVPAAPGTAARRVILRSLPPPSSVSL